MSLEQNLTQCINGIELIGLITRAPKALGWKPSYTLAWDHLWSILEKGSLTNPDYEHLKQTEQALLLQDYHAQEVLLKHWPEFDVDLEKINKNKEKSALKHRIKEISFINHLGPYKGWLFPTEFSTSLDIVVSSGFRSVHPEPGFEINILSGLESAVTDQELGSVLSGLSLFKDDGKSKVYTYKVNHGKVILPYDLRDLMVSYGAIIAQKLSLKSGAAFTVDYMVSLKAGVMILCPIEIHLTPLGIVHDFANTGLANQSYEFTKKLAKQYPEIAIYTSCACLSEGFSLGELTYIKSKLEQNGAHVVLTSDPKELALLDGYFVFPYKADFSSMNGNPTILPKELGIKMENKNEINLLLSDSEINGVVKPKYVLIDSDSYWPDFYRPDKTFVNPNTIKEDMRSYLDWKDKHGLSDWVVIKPVRHHEWKPQILYLKDLTDACVLFKRLGKQGEVIVEEMVMPNLVLGNGEIRTFYQVK